MKARFFSGDDEWTTVGEKITSPACLEKIRAVLEAAPIIVEHRFYRGASAPNRLVFDDFGEFTKYLHNNASAGDAIYVWNFGATCTEDNVLAKGKCPNDEDQYPKKGAY